MATNNFRDMSGRVIHIQEHDTFNSITDEGKPITIVDGIVDDDTISDLDSNSKIQVFDWFICHISESNNEAITTTFIRNILYRDTGIMLSINQVKDAMIRYGINRMSIDMNLNPWVYFAAYSR